MTPDLGAGVLQKAFDNGDFIGLDQHVGDGLGDRRANRHGELTFTVAITNNFDELRVLQDIAAHQYRMRNFGIVVCQRENQFRGRVGLVGQTDCQMLADRYFDFMDQLPQNIAHGCAFAFVQDTVLVEEQVADDLDKFAPRRSRTIAVQTQQCVNVEGALSMAFSKQGRTPGFQPCAVRSMRHSAPFRLPTGKWVCLQP